VGQWVYKKNQEGRMNKALAEFVGTFALDS